MNNEVVRLNLFSICLELYPAENHQPVLFAMNTPVMISRVAAPWRRVKGSCRKTTPERTEISVLMAAKEAEDVVPKTSMP